MNSEKTRIEFDFEEKHYKLEYTLNSIKKLEKAGVKFNKLDEMIFTAPETLFYGAFLANHPTMDRKTANRIYKALKRTAEDAEVEYDEDGREVDALTNALGSMLREVSDEFVGRGGNVTWKIT